MTTITPMAVRRYHHHWTLRTAAVVIAILVTVFIALYFTGEAIAQRVLAEKLQALISQQLNARLDIGSLRYHFPYAVSVGDVSLVTKGPQGGDLTLMSFKTLGITLAQFPLKKGPLVIERVDFDRPTVHLIETKSGFIGESNLIRNDDDKKKDSEPPPKLSDILQLRHVAFTEMRAEYDDRTQAGGRPLVWEHLNATFDSQPLNQEGQQASHRFSFTAENGDVARIFAEGTLDLDSLVLKFEQLKLDTALSPDRPPAALPAEAQRLLKEAGISGQASVVIKGEIPLTHTRDIAATADVRIEKGKCIIPGYQEPLEDLTLIASGEYKNRNVRLDISRFDARTASIGISVQPAGGIFNRTSGRWLIDPIKAAVVYEPVDSMKKFWRQKLSLDLRVGVHQMDERSRVQIVIDGTKLTPQGLAGVIDLNGTVVFGDGGLTLRDSTITGLGGPITLLGMANVRNDAYELKVTATDIDMAKINVILDPVASKEMFGTLTGEIRATMIGGPDTIHGEGGFRIEGGKFARVPVLSPIADFLHIGQGAFVANDAFGHFMIEKNGLGFDRLAVSTSVLRIRGQGTIGFDTALNLKVYADSASNWGRTVRKTGVPLFSNLVGAVAGGTQSVIGSVSKQFTTLAVTGTIDKPKIRPAPAPLLTENLERLFRVAE